TGSRRSVLTNKPESLFGVIRKRRSSKSCPERIQGWHNIPMYENQTVCNDVGLDDFVAGKQSICQLNCAALVFSSAIHTCERQGRCRIVPEGKFDVFKELDRLVFCFDRLNHK